MSLLWQPVLTFSSSLCFPWPCLHVCLFYNSLYCIYTVGLQEPVLHLDVSIYICFCAAPVVSVYKSLVLHMNVSVYKSFVLHLDESAY